MSPAPPIGVLALALGCSALLGAQCGSAAARTPAAARIAAVRLTTPATRLKPSVRVHARRRFPSPILGRTVEASPVRGIVFFRPPGAAQASGRAVTSAAGKGLGFIPLREPRAVPIGSTFDTTQGVVRLTTATASAGTRQSGDFGAGVFTLLQNRRERGLTRLDIVDVPSASAVCASVGRLASIARRRRHLSSAVLGRLNADDHGRFEVRGDFSAAAARGTVFSVTDRCDGTFTVVSRGSVLVSDFARRMTIALRAGGSYLARATVFTGVASNLTPTSAELNATANPNGGEVTSCAFEYGTTSSYGRTALCSALPGSGTSPVPVLAPVSALSPHTIFHFRISATNAGGVSTGEDGAFETPPFPPSLTKGEATAITPTSATLRAALNPNGGAVSRCVFEFGPTEAYGRIASCSLPPAPGEGFVTVLGAATGLASNTAFHARLVATGTGGSSTGPDFAFRTPRLPPGVEAREASSVTQNGATLNAVVNPNGSEVTACEFEYGPTEMYGETAPCTPAPGADHEPVAVSAPVQGWTPNTALHFRVIATSREGTTATTDHALTTLPLPPVTTTGNATEVTQTTATLTGAVQPNGAELTSCRFEFGPTEAYGSTTPCSKTPPASEFSAPVSATIAGLSPGKTYHFRLVASNAGGSSPAEDQTVNTPPSPLLVETPEPRMIAGSTLKETVTVAESPFGDPGVKVRFTVTGANPQQLEATTNEEGEATLTYVGEKLGTDHIEISYTNSKGQTFTREVTTTWFGVTVGVPPRIELRGVHATILSLGEEGPAPIHEGVGGAVAAGGFSPRLGATVAVALVSGKVFLKEPRARASAATEAASTKAPARGAATHVVGETLVPVGPAVQLAPVGSELQATGGVVLLTSALPGGRQSGEFGGGRFTVAQPVRAGGLTELDLVDGSTRRCAGSGGASRAGNVMLGRLNASYTGRFLVRGRGGTAATLGGPATFSVGDTCEGTLTVVTRGRVLVHDRAGNRNVVIRSGGAYLARAG
ncbi:MAG TPA: fibronectin type III domain-containing protein [Solirubrobacteraceae bacterium]|nr:fibronectin type III domain-containing protein [Solirubrobacteraceae bacterium]